MKLTVIKIDNRPNVMKFNFQYKNFKFICYRDEKSFFKPIKTANNKFVS